MAQKAHDHEHGKECGCGPDDPCCGNHADEIEIVELEDENGEKEEFAILDEVDFENRHFCIMAPLAELQAISEGGDDQDDSDLSIEIFEVDGENFTVLEDEDLAKRLLAHLDELSAKLEEEEKGE